MTIENIYFLIICQNDFVANIRMKSAADYFVFIIMQLSPQFFITEGKMT